MFNINHIDSNSEFRLLYDSSDIYDIGYFKVYFVNSTTSDLKSVFDILDLEITSYVIDNKKYYSRNLNELENDILKNKSIDELIYYNDNGIKIDGINVICSINELIKLEEMVDIY